MSRYAKTDISPAERAVAQLVLEGWSNKEIASTLHKSDLTVKSHVAAILRKTQAPSRSRFIALYYRGELPIKRAALVASGVDDMHTRPRPAPPESVACGESEPAAHRSGVLLR